MDSYERVCTTLAHKQPDRPPLELLATDGIIEDLRAHVGAVDQEEILGRLVRERIELLGKGGGLMLAPTNSNSEDVPLDSIMAMYDEAQKG